MQTANTINLGDALKDALTAFVLKEKRAGLWYGSVENDRTVKSHDFTMHAKTGVRLFNFPVEGKVRVGYGGASICEVMGKTLDLDTATLPLDVDYFVHVRPTNAGGYIALIVNRATLPAYVRQYGKVNFRKSSNTCQVQMNTFVPTPIEGSKKWNDLMRYTVATVDASALMGKVETLLGKVNEVGRKDATANASNPWLNDRKVGIPYGER